MMIIIIIIIISVDCVLDISKLKPLRDLEMFTLTGKT